MKKVLSTAVIVAVVVIAALATVPLWGSCDLKANVCKTWCSVRHFNEDLKEAGCRTRCATDNMSCLAEQGADSVDDFIEGFNSN